MSYFVKYPDGVMGERCISLAEAAREGLYYKAPEAHIIWDPTGDPQDTMDEGTVASVAEDLALDLDDE